MRRGIAEGPRLYAAVFLFAAAVLFLRQPEAVLNAQFWAEDGAVWYRHAHELGALQPFLMTQDGYFSTYLRVVALLAQALPLAAAPLFMTAVAIAVQAAPAAFVMSSRFKDVMPGLRTRFTIATLYLLLPNTAEIHGNATNAQWYLALLALMIVVARPASSRAGRAADAATLALAGLSGPYAIFLTPLAYLRWRKEGIPQRLRQLRILAVTGTVQLLALFVLNAGSRFGYRPDADLATLLSMLQKQIFAGGIIGMRGYAFVMAHAAMPLAILVTLSILGIAVFAVGAKRGPWQLRYLLAFAGMNFMTSLLAPNIGRTAGAADYAERAWPTLLASSSGSRYWFLPILALLTTAFWLTAKKNPRAMRALGTAMLCVATVGIAADFRDATVPDLGFPRQAAAYAALRPGEVIVIPLNPPGWEMELTKK